MALNLDISKLTQAGARKPTAHDNCIVLDLGTGPFPRDIEVRLPDDDGARQNALWDGSLNLAVNDEVLCFEYSGISAWRVMAMGGNDGGAGKARVSEVWESDFGAVALETDASGNVTINGTRTVAIPTDLIHAGDADTKLSFADDDVEIAVGGLSMLKLTEAGQDLITLGPGSGDVDIDFNGQMFLRGSDGQLGLGTVLPNASLQIGNVSLGVLAGFGMILSDSTANSQFRIGQSITGRLVIRWNFNATAANASASIFIPEEQDLFIQESGGNTSLGHLGAPQGILHSYDSISGFLLWEFDGLNATVRTVVANGTGDILYRLTAMYVLRDSAAAVASGTTDVSNGASVNLTVGGNTVRLRVNADGSCDIARTAGTDTIKVALALRWL